MSEYFIRIDESTDVRRKVLESSKGSIHALRAYQQLVVIRNQKRSLYAELRRDLKEVTLVLNKIEQLLPAFTQQELDEFASKRQQELQKEAVKTALVKVNPVKVAKTLPKKSPQVADIVIEEPTSDLDRLEAALSRVEERLGKL